MVEEAACGELLMGVNGKLEGPCQITGQGLFVV